MPIIGTLPNNIQNGQLADAVPVMADFNFIVNQVNANAAPLGALTAPSGTRMLFNQASPPLGWTQEVGAAFNDTSLRIVTSAGGGTGGSTSWSTWNFGGTLNVNAFTLSVAQLPAHTHTDNGHAHTVTDNGHAHTVFHDITGGGATQPLNAGQGVSNTQASPTSTDASNISINLGFAQLLNTGSGAAIQPNFTTPLVKFTDFIIGVKS